MSRQERRSSWYYVGARNRHGCTLYYVVVPQVNQAEAEYWRRSAGTRVGYSDEILGFDCGGQQWVLEVRGGGVSWHDDVMISMFRGEGWGKEASGIVSPLLSDPGHLPSKS